MVHLCDTVAASIAVFRSRRPHEIPAALADLFLGIEHLVSREGGGIEVDVVSGDAARIRDASYCKGDERCDEEKRHSANFKVRNHPGRNVPVNNVHSVRVAAEDDRQVHSLDDVRGSLLQSKEVRDRPGPLHSFFEEEK